MSISSVRALGKIHILKYVFILRNSKVEIKNYLQERKVSVIIEKEKQLKLLSSSRELSLEWRNGQRAERA